MASAGEKPSRPPDRPPGKTSAPESADQADRFWLDEFGTRPPGAQPDKDGGRPDEQSTSDSVRPSDLSWLDEYTGEARRQSLLDRWEQRQEELKRVTAQRLQELRAARAQRPRRRQRKRRPALKPQELIRRPDAPSPKRQQAAPRAPEPAKEPARQVRPRPTPSPPGDYSHLPPPPASVAKRLRAKPQPRRRMSPARIRGLTRLTILLTTVAGAFLLVAPWFGLQLGSSDNTATSSLVPGQRTPSSTAGSVTAGPFFPVSGRFYYGEGGARFGASRGGRAHEGQDVFSREGAPLIAVRDGIVVDRARESGPYSSGKGNYIAIYSPVDKRSYVYFHMLRPPKLKKGDRVGAGQRIGAMGCTGSCYGVHLHFEIRLGRATLRSDRKAIDPLPFLKRWDRTDPGARKTGYGRY